MFGCKGLRETSYSAFFMTQTILTHQHTLEARKSHASFKSITISTDTCTMISPYKDSVQRNAVHLHSAKHM